MKKIAFLFIVCLSMGLIVMAQDKDSLAQYTGKYIFPSGSLVSFVNVTAEAGKLNFSSDQGSGTLQKIAADSFSIPEYQGTAKYNRNADNGIATVTIDVMGYHLVGTKETAVAAPNKIALLNKRQRNLKGERRQLITG